MFIQQFKLATSKWLVNGRTILNSTGCIGRACLNDFLNYYVVITFDAFRAIACQAFRATTTHDNCVSSSIQQIVVQRWFEISFWKSRICELFEYGCGLILYLWMHFNEKNDVAVDTNERPAYRKLHKIILSNRSAANTTKRIINDIDISWFSIRVCCSQKMGETKQWPNYMWHTQPQTHTHTRTHTRLLARVRAQAVDDIDVDGTRSNGMKIAFS